MSFGAASDTPLPRPVLDGSTATYPDVLPGVDVTVEVRPTGFEQLWVAKTPAGLDRLLTDQAGGDQGVAAAMSLDDVTAKPQAGGVAFVDDDNKTVGKLNPPTVWDAATAPSGEALNTDDADVAVLDDGDPVSPKGGTGDLDVSVTPDQAWLDDPARVFPVTIDPTYVAATSSPIFDTYVQDDQTTDKSGSPTMPVGMSSIGNKSRGFFNFSTAPFVGKLVTSASLRLWATEAGTCTANGWSAYNAGAASTSTRWTAQPSITTKYATSTETKGYSASCPDGAVNIDMKTQAQAWADGTATTKGVALKSDNETSYTYYHRFNSSEAGGEWPVLNWTYNRAPVTPAQPTVNGALSYAPSGGSTSYLYTPDSTPSMSGTVSDPDGNTVRGYFNATTASDGSGTVLATCSQGGLASGSTATCDLDTALANNSKVYVRQRTKDNNGVYGSYGPTRELRVATTTPATPVITCPGYASGTWPTTGPGPGGMTCTISAVGTSYSAPSAIRYSINSGAGVTVPIPQSSSPTTAKITVPISGEDGSHRLAARAITPSGLESDRAVWAAGWGNPSLISPIPDTQATTTDTVVVAAAGPSVSGGAPTTTATIQWRVAGATSTTGWVTAPTGNTLTVATSGYANANGVFDTTTVVGQTDGNAITVPARTSTLLEMRVCFQYSGTSLCTPTTSILRVPHAFGAGFPVADAGPGQVGLWTGELQLDDTDATLSTPSGDVSVSRTHSSFAGPATDQNKVFGPGWAASFDGDGSGLGGAELIDATTYDGSLTVLDSDGGLLVYTIPDGKRRTGTAFAAGTYTPASVDTKNSGVTLKVSGTQNSTVAELTGDDGIVTKFQVTAAPTTGPSTFKTVEVREPATSSSTTYSYDTAGRVIAITAPLPDGVTTCAPGTATSGCRVLKISYTAAGGTTATASTPGDFENQVKAIAAQVNTDTDRTLATYKYDSAGRLVEAKDARTNLATSYTWTGTGTGLRLATLTPPGLAAYTFNYDTTANKLNSVTRPNPASAGGGTAQLAAYIYNVPVAGTVKDLPDMGSEVAKWGQASAPTTIQAVFGPDKAITAPPTAGSEDWKYADLQMTDPQGYTVNTAGYGAGDWQLTAADYDTHDNITRAWDERAIRALRNGLYPSGAADQLATKTVYNDDILNGTTVLTPAGTLVTDTYGPVHPVAVGSTSDGTMPLRTHTQISYDQGAPVNTDGVNDVTKQPFRLPTKTVTTAEDAAGVIASTIDISFTGYEPIVSGDTTGWVLGQATTTTTDMDRSGTINAGDITTTTRYDTRGRVVENRQPKSNGNDAGTRVTTYYTGGTSSVSGCGSKPQYAGYVCQVGPAAQPAGQTMPTTTTTSYTWDGQGSTETDTSDAVTSTTTTTFDAQDRPQTSTVAVAGLASSTAVPAVTTTYDAATGLTTGSTSTAGDTGTTYDSWGRQLTSSNTPAGQTADTATTTYNDVGRVISVVDGNGQTTYLYGDTDVTGKAERRGLPTSVKVKTTGGTEYETVGGYDEAGDLTYEKLPGQIIKRTSIDIAGEQTQLTYNGQAVDDATGTLQPDQPWLGWSTTSNAKGQTVREWTPDGAGYDGELGATAIASDRSYSYDQAGRLTKVQDRTGNPDGTNPVGCTTRTYAFDDNGNRTGQDSLPAQVDGSCGTTGGNPVARAYDTADRPTTGANGTGSYTYDQLGRQTLIPASDAPKPADGNITLGYYDTDAAKTITQNGTTTAFTLDGAGRRLLQTSTTGATTNNTLLRHYTDDSDNPTWTVDTTGTTTTTTRYNELLNGDLGLTLTTVGATTTAALDLTTPRGDTAANVTLPGGATGPTGTSANGIDTWNEYTEYGQPRQAVIRAPGGTAGVGYGWLGSKQRAGLPEGITLMGVRLYNKTTSLFTSTDPIEGGNTTPYVYPQDPINSSDLAGTKSTRADKLRCIAHPVQCATWAAVSKWANRLAAKTYRSNTDGYRRDRRNGFRHLIWQAMLTVDLGASNAYKWGQTHEDGAPNDLDHLADVANNKTGRAIGRKASKMRDIYNLKDWVVNAAKKRIRKGQYRHDYIGPPAR